MTFKARGFIIGKMDIREYDRLFTIYSLEHGKIQALGVGTKKISSKLSGSLEVLTFATFSIAKGRQLDRITGVDTHHRFNNISKSLDHLASTLHCLEITDKLIQGQQRDDELFLLLHDLLYTMNKTHETKPLNLARLYLLKLCIVLGYQPDQITSVSIEEVIKKRLHDLSDLSPKKETDTAIESILENTLTRAPKSQVFYDYLRGETSY